MIFNKLLFYKIYLAKINNKLYNIKLLTNIEIFNN